MSLSAHIDVTQRNGLEVHIHGVFRDHVVHQIIGLLAEEAGFTLDAEWEESLAQLPENLLQQATASGFETVDELLAENIPVLTADPERRLCKDESLPWNFIIEGDNLQALYLLEKTHRGKVDCIYIDPPYNTGNDFVYNDDFGKDKGTFEETSGLFDEEGNQTIDPMQRNTESNGRFHTDWLNMIYPRLKVAKDLLTDDGVIFISIDDRESDNLIKVCDEIFGASSFVGNISWQKTYSPRNDSKGIPAEKESIIIYGRKQGWMPKRLPRTEEMNKMYGNPDNDGHFYFAYFNCSDHDIEVKKGDVIGQVGFQKYLGVDNDYAEGVRVGGFGSTDDNKK